MLFKHIFYKRKGRRPCKIRRWELEHLHGHLLQGNKGDRRSICRR